MKKTAEANATANEKVGPGRKDATKDKLGARYKAAKERCDTYAGNAKAVCVQQAKVKFGQ